MVCDTGVEYVPRLGFPYIVSTLSFFLTIYFFKNWQDSGTFIYLFICCLALLVCVFFINPVLLNQKVRIENDQIVISYRIKRTLNLKISESLYEIVMRSNNQMSFRFKTGKYRAQISPVSYHNGDELLEHLIGVIKNKKLIVNVVER